MATDDTSASEVTHYEVLGLSAISGAGGELPAQQLKAAYRRALLQHHPDKAQPNTGNHNSRTQNFGLRKYTVDQISQAYATLSAPKLRSEYDRALKLKASSMKLAGYQEGQPFRTGFETVDLDDMNFDDESEEWYRSCRCGEDRGFLVQEADLEEASKEGELHVGCRGCSLWLLVLFGVVEDNGATEMINGEANG